VYDLKLNQILAQGSLVAIWVSNNPKIQKFVKEKYFKSLNITLIEEWYWIKVTQSGELVVPFSQESYRKPFEVLFVGKVDGEQDKIKRKVMVGIPSKHHSRKPFIHGNIINLRFRFVIFASRMSRGTKIGMFCSEFVSWLDELGK
jgi:N6-adenosine-specific RNA methylase IME4